MKIALGQLKIFWEDKKANIGRGSFSYAGNESNRVFHEHGKNEGK